MEINNSDHKTWVELAAELTGRELRARRLELRLSQSQLAELLTVAPNTLARWERDEIPMGHPAMISLALDAIEKRLRSRGSF